MHLIQFKNISIYILAITVFFFGSSKQHGEQFVMIIFMLLCLSSRRISSGKWLISAVGTLGEGPAFYNPNRLKTPRNKMAPFSVRQQYCKAVNTHSQQSLDSWGILVQTPSPVTFDVLLLTHTHHTYAGQPAALSSYCLPALKSRPSVQLCMGSVPIYNRGMGGRGVSSSCIVTIFQHFLLSFTDLFSTSCLCSRLLAIPRVVHKSL